VEIFYYIHALIPRLNAIEQFFSQMKHYLKLYKSKNFEELKLNLTKSIKNIKFL
jgi:transposase